VIDKLQIYVISIPNTRDRKRFLFGIKIVDPNLDFVALYKRIQQRLLKLEDLSASANYRQNVSSNGKSDPAGREVDKMYKRELEPYCVPGLREGFHNEGVVYNKLADVSNSLADYPSLFFRFLCDYMQCSFFPNEFHPETVGAEDDEMTKIRLAANDFGSNPLSDAYAQVDHPLNPHNLFTFERAMNFFKVYDKRHNRDIAHLSDHCIQVVDNPTTTTTTTATALSSSDTTDGEKPPTYMQYCKLNFDAESRKRGFTCYRYQASAFRWCFFDSERGKYGGLLTQMMPYDTPVFQLNADAYKLILEKRETIRKKTNLRYNRALVLPSSQRGLRSNENGGEEVEGDDDEEEDDDYGMSPAFLRFRAANGKSSENAPRWDCLHAIKNTIVEQSTLVALPTNKLPVIHNSFLLYLHLIEDRIMKHLNDLKPSRRLRLKDINHFGKHAGRKTRRLQKYIEYNNVYVKHLKTQQEKMMKFTKEQFLNTSAINKKGYFSTNGWKAVVAFYSDLEEKSKIFSDNRASDALRPSYYHTYWNGLHMRSSIDSVIGSHFEHMARLVFEQVELYRNNSVFFTTMLVSMGDLFKMDGEDKLHIYLTGAFALGKSFFLNFIVKLCLPGLVQHLQGASALAFAGTGYEGDQIIVAPEDFQPFMESVELMKAALTDGNTVRAVCHYDSATGTRQMVIHHGVFQNITLVAGNKSPTDLALLDRLFMVKVTENSKIRQEFAKEMTKEIIGLKTKTHFREIASSVLDRLYSRHPELNRPNVAESLEDLTLSLSTPPTSTTHPIPPTLSVTPIMEVPINTNVRKVTRTEKGLILTQDDPRLRTVAVNRMSEYWQFIQILLFAFYKFQAQDLTCKVSTHVHDNLMERLTLHVKKVYPWCLPNPRHTKKIGSASRNICVIDGIRRAFFDPASIYYDKPFKWEYIRAIEPYLSVTASHTFIAMSLFAEQMVQELKEKIIFAFLQASGFYDYCQQLLYTEKPGDVCLLDSHKRTLTPCGSNVVVLDREFVQKSKMAKVLWKRFQAHIPRENENPASGNNNNNTSSSSSESHARDTVWCYDLNTVTISRESSHSWGLSEFLKFLKTELTKYGLPDIDQDLFDKEIASLMKHMVEYTEQYAPVPEQIIKGLSVGDGNRRGVSVTAVKNEHFVKINSNDKNNEKSEYLMSFETRKNIDPEGGSYIQQITLNIQAMAYLEGTPVVASAAKRVAEEIPLRKVRVPVIIHLPGAHLLDMEIGQDYETTPPEELNELKIKQNTSDAYRQSTDYEPVSSDDDEEEKQEAREEEDEEGCVKLHPSLDIDDYGRLMHLLDSNRFEIRTVTTSYPGSNPNPKHKPSPFSNMEVKIRDYTKKPGAPGAEKWVPIPTLFESVGRDKLWENTMNNPSFRQKYEENIAKQFERNEQLQRQQEQQQQQEQEEQLIHKRRDNKNKIPSRRKLHFDIAKSSLAPRTQHSQSQIEGIENEDVEEQLQLLMLASQPTENRTDDAGELARKEHQETQFYKDFEDEDEEDTQLRQIFNSVDRPGGQPEEEEEDGEDRLHIYQAGAHAVGRGSGGYNYHTYQKNQEEEEAEDTTTTPTDKDGMDIDSGGDDDDDNNDNEAENEQIGRHTQNEEDDENALFTHLVEEQERERERMQLEHQRELELEAEEAERQRQNSKRKDHKQQKHAQRQEGQQPLIPKQKAKRKLSSSTASDTNTETESISPFKKQKQSQNSSPSSSQSKDTNKKNNKRN
jgi:hypothetical protein